MKNRTEASAGKLIANEVLEKLWMHLIVNFITKYQMQFALEGESLQSWLRYTQSVKTLCNELGDVDLSEQPWPQLMCYISYEPHGHNFRGWFCKKRNKVYHH